jgi:hypothetical protein
MNSKEMQFIQLLLKALLMIFLMNIASKQTQLEYY